MVPLPIDPHLPFVVAALRERGALVLTAEPGAGKTTRVPRALLDAGWGERGEILVLEPRRLAARLAARRVAAELGESPGSRVGYTVRFDDESGPDTRVRFVTEGVTTRRLVADPELRGVAAVLLDEFHERSLHADLALAWVRRLRATQRPDLAVVVMSATLDAERVAGFLGAEVPVLRVPGRAHPVRVRHAAASADGRPLERRVVAALRDAIETELEGDALVFLPGAAEIRRAREALGGVADAWGVEVRMLHGALPPREQDAALAPSERRRVILATNVAETSITVDGVRIVVDSGLARVARHSAWSGLPSLVTESIGRHSAEQRAGRAGRTAPGTCVRLYSEMELASRPAGVVPKIVREDLAELALTVRALGAEGIDALEWLDDPPRSAVDAAEQLLARLGAVDEAGRLTERGRAMGRVPAHPRAAALALVAGELGFTDAGALAAALVGERDVLSAARAVLGDAPREASTRAASDLLVRMDAVRAAGSSRGVERAAARDVRKAAAQIRRAMPRCAAGARAADEDEAVMRATLVAFSDRLARRRSAGSEEVVFAGGGAGRIEPISAVHDGEFLVAVDARQARRGEARVTVASAVEPAWVLEACADRLEVVAEPVFDERAQRVVVREAIELEGLPIEESVRRDVRDEAVSAALRDAVRKAGLDAVCDADERAAWLARVRFAAQWEEAVPAFGEDDLWEMVDRLCEGRASFAELREARVLACVEASWPGGARAALERCAPERVRLHDRRRPRVNYELDRPPWIASRLQDFFGMHDGPKVAGGRVPLVLHLLAPNGRAVQVTTDLRGFWEREYPRVRRELGRRYPKHAWPENPR